jgi:hypothetical protein
MMLFERNKYWMYILLEGNFFIRLIELLKSKMYRNKQVLNEFDLGGYISARHFDIKTTERYLHVAKNSW